MTDLQNRAGRTYSEKQIQIKYGVGHTRYVTARSVDWKLVSCPECQNRFREYLIFRASVARFVGFLDDLEIERQRILEEQRPEGAELLVRFKATLMTEMDEST